MVTLARSDFVSDASSDSQLPFDELLNFINDENRQRRTLATLETVLRQIPEVDLMLTGFVF